MKYYNDNVISQKGQVVLVLILVMTVALAIGLSVIQRSLSDVSTSSKVEQSSRAFSAAEAGIEKAISANSAINSQIDLGNSSQIAGVDKNDIPAARQAFEYLPLAKEELAHVWLADPETLAAVYTQTSINVYWGVPNITADKPALEVTVIYRVGGNYISQKFFLDSDSNRTNSNSNPNHFTDVSANCTSSAVVDTTLGTNRVFLCKYTLIGLYSGSEVPMLLRARILYSNTSQPFAVQPVGGSSLPVQARMFTSTGVSGATQRKIQVLRIDKVVPPYFDYAIFSAGDISK